MGVAPRLEFGAVGWDTFGGRRESAGLFVLATPLSDRGQDARGPPKLAQVLLSMFNEGAMSHEELLQRISMDPAVCGGRPCIRGHRIWVSLIVDLLATGMSLDAILANTRN